MAVPAKPSAGNDVAASIAFFGPAINTNDRVIVAVCSSDQDLGFNLAILTAPPTKILGKALCRRGCGCIQ